MKWHVLFYSIFTAAEISTHNRVTDTVPLLIYIYRFYYSHICAYRMYYRQYVVEKIPESLHALMPLNPQGNFRYEDPESSKYDYYWWRLKKNESHWKRPSWKLLFSVLFWKNSLAVHLCSTADNAFTSRLCSSVRDLVLSIAFEFFADIGGRISPPRKFSSMPICSTCM